MGNRPTSSIISALALALLLGVGSTPQPAFGQAAEKFTEEALRTTLKLVPPALEVGRKVAEATALSTGCLWAVAVALGVIIVSATPGRGGAENCPVHSAKHPDDLQRLGEICNRENVSCTFMNTEDLRPDNTPPWSPVFHSEGGKMVLGFDPFDEPTTNSNSGGAVPPTQDFDDRTALITNMAGQAERNPSEIRDAAEAELEDARDFLTNDIEELLDQALALAQLVSAETDLDWIFSDIAKLRKRWSTLR